MQQKKFFFDVETTGVVASKHCIWQLAGLMEVDGQVVDQIEFKCRPAYPENINPKALELSGLTKEEMMAFQPGIDAYKQLTRWLDRHINKYDRNDKAALVGFNVDFDEQFLRQFFKRASDPYFGAYFWSGRIDVLSLALDHLLDRRPHMDNFKLETVAKEFGISSTEWHDALADIAATRQIYQLVRLPRETSI